MPHVVLLETASVMPHYMYIKKLNKALQLRKFVFTLTSSCYLMKTSLKKRI